MSLVRSPLRGSAIAPDEAFRRLIGAIGDDIEPDPLFRRRLRGAVLNEFVAAREGVASPAPRGGSIAGRVARAGLYACLALGMSVGAAMAASQGALPGDPLYGLKLEVEQLRMSVAPAAFRDDLAIAALGERIHELAQLDASTEWDRDAAIAAIAAIRDDYAQLAALGIQPATSERGGDARLESIDKLIGDLPPQARAAVAEAMAAAPPPPDPGNDAPGPEDRPVEPGSEAHGPPAHAGVPGWTSHGPAQGGGARSGGSTTGGSNNGGSNPNGSTNNGGTNPNGPAHSGGGHDQGNHNGAGQGAGAGAGSPANPASTKADKPDKEPPPNHP